MENILTITELTPQKRNKNRYNIYSDGEYIASLGSEACAAFGIRAGARISERDMKEAVARDNERWAFDSAAAMLSHSAKTRSEIEERLKSKGIDEAAVKAAVKKLSEYGYIDDAAYAAEYIQCTISQGKSRRAAEYALRSKGLSNDAISVAMQAYTSEAENEAAQENAESLIRAGKDRCQIYAALARRGFDYETIKSVLPEEED